MDSQKIFAIIANRCPRCYQGKIYQKYLTPNSVCDECGLNLADIISGDGPAVAVIFLSGLFGVMMVLLGYYLFQISIAVALLIWLASICLASFISLPILKTMMIYLEYSQNANR